MARFSGKTLEYLTKAGWSEERRIDIAPLRAALEAKGYVVPPVVAAFLERYGNLQLHKGLGIEVHFDPIKAASHVCPGHVTRWEARLRAGLCVIGEMEGGYFTIVMDFEGRVYAGQDDLLLKKGDSPDEAVDNLAMVKKGREVPER
ncbi:MAG: SUKH-3 domain-containing protein [Actinobacteria bacterium]|nr:SUKH-3 domain-containing protein [Actinomycetota bacterium]